MITLSFYPVLLGTIAGLVDYNDVIRRRLEKVKGWVILLGRSSVV